LIIQDHLAKDDFFFRPLGREDEGNKGTCIRGEEEASKERESLVATGKKI
jgi:hypothetical protein